MRSRPAIFTNGIHVSHLPFDIFFFTTDPHSNEIVHSSRPEDRISPLTDSYHSTAGLHAKRKHSQNATVDQREITPAPRPREADVYVPNKNAVTEIPRAGNKGVPRKTRKRNPKRTAVYYYKATQEIKDSTGQQPRGVGHETNSLKDVPLEGQGPRMPISTHQRKSHNYAAPANAKQVKSQGNPNGGYYFNPPTHSASCQEKSTRFEYEKASHRESPKQFNYAEATGKFPRERHEPAPTLNNMGLDNVKIVEVHSIGQKMDIVYPDKTGNGPVSSARRPNEDYRSSVSAANVPVSAPQPHYIQRKEPVPKEPAPVQTSAPPVKPVVHYLPVYAIPSSTGQVQYQAVPGAAILEKVTGSSNLYAPVGNSNETKPQPAYQQQPPTTAPPQQPPPQPQVPPAMPPQPQVQGPSHTEHHLPQKPPQGPVVYQPRMMSNPATHPVQPPPPPMVQPGYPPRPSNPPVAAMPYPPPDPRVMTSQAYPPQTAAQPVSAPPYVVTKSEPVSPQQLSPPPGVPVVTSQPYPAPVQAVGPPQPQHYPMPNQPVPGQHPYPPQDQKLTRPPMYPAQYQAAPNQTPYPVHVVPVSLPYPQATQQVPTSQPAPPVQTAPGPVPPPQHQYPPERPPQPYYQPHGAPAVQYQPEKPPPVQVHYYPANRPPTEPTVMQQYPDQKPVHLPSLPYPVVNTSQPPTPQYTPDGKDQQRFVYAPPPPDFMHSPVYRVPATEAPTMVQASLPPSQPPKGAKRRKTAMPHREIRDSSSPPESYPQQSTSPELQCNERMTKSPPGQNPALNKSSCVITPPGSPQDDDNGSYTVVMRDYGIQAGPPTEQSTWTVKVESAAPRVYISEKEALADANGEVMSDEEEEYELEEEEEEEEEEEDYSELDGDENYSPTQKENRSPGGFPDTDENGNPLPRKHRRKHAKYTCKFCHKGFQWYSHLTSHERTHTGEKPFKCPECSRAFTRADGLQCHMLVHSKKRPFKCHYCSKGFNDNTSLEKHTYSHTGVKPFKCEYCGRAFSDSQSIEKHLLVHIGTKPYKCQFCVRSFNDSQMLVRHIRSHTGEKPFKCQHCQMAFSKQSALVIHTRVHTGEKPYQCPHCSKCFSISGNLQRHILIHTGERPYRCSKCPKAFNNPSHLSRHISKLHAPQVKPERVVDNRPSFSVQGSNTSEPIHA